VGWLFSLVGAFAIGGAVMHPAIRHWSAPLISILGGLSITIATILVAIGFLARRMEHDRVEMTDRFDANAEEVNQRFDAMELAKEWAKKKPDDGNGE